MVIYDSVRSIMNTTENMEHLIVNTRYDGTTLQYQDVDWFQFNGKVISNIYVSDNSFIDFSMNIHNIIEKCFHTLPIIVCLKFQNATP